MFIEKQINPNRIILDTVGGQAHATSIITVASGREQRNANLAQSRGRWDMGDRMLTREEKDEVETHFNVCRGRLHGFRFKDWSNYLAAANDTAIVLTTTPQGTLSGQMKKQYKLEGQTYRKEIKKPVPGTVKIYKNSVELKSGVTVDYTTGLVTVSLSTGCIAGDVLQWSGEYDLPVRYDSDELKLKFEAVNDDGGQLFYLYSLPIVELVL
jgi:uncharacterized protein (TIGR02217 family)